MDDDIQSSTGLTPEASRFLDEPMTRLEVIRMIQPLRSATLTLFNASMASLVVLTGESADPKNSEKARKAFDELREIFSDIERFDRQLNRLLDGRMLWDSEDEQATHE